MKKSVKTLALACVAACCVNNANAKTEGNYIGINVVEHEIGFDYDEPVYVPRSFTHSGVNNTDLSISYKYAFNYKNFILAPELIYGVGLGDYQETYAAKIHVGYDLTDNFAFLVNIGFDSNNNIEEREAITYGLAAKYQLDENWNLEASLDIREKGLDLKTTSFGISYNF